MRYQVTLFDKSGKYRPVSAIIETDTEIATKEDKKKIQMKGIEKICFKRNWGKKDLAKYGYTSIKIREYDEEKIKAEYKENFEKLKEEKFASGEWKRPKEKK